MPDYRLQLINRAGQAYRAVTLSCSDDDTARIMARLAFSGAELAVAARLWDGKRQVEVLGALPGETGPQ